MPRDAQAAPPLPPSLQRQLRDHLALDTQDCDCGDEKREARARKAQYLLTMLVRYGVLQSGGG